MTVSLASSPQGMSQEKACACRTGANAVTLSRVLPFCVTPPDPVIQSESQKLMLRGHKQANARRAYHTPATSPRILRSGKAELQSGEAGKDEY